MVFKHTLLRDDDEIPVIVRGRYESPERGFRNSMGIPEEPDEPSSFEVHTVHQETDGALVRLTDKEEEEIQQAAVELVEDQDR